MENRPDSRRKSSGGYRLHEWFTYPPTLFCLLLVVAVQGCCTVVPTAERQKMASTTQMRSDAGVHDDVLVELKWDPKISPNSDFS
jgi:hypothetical protein